MRKYIYSELVDPDGHKAIIQSYFEDAVEYVENIYTDGSPEMEATVYEAGYRKWWDDDEFRIK